MRALLISIVAVAALNPFCAYPVVAADQLKRSTLYYCHDESTSTPIGTGSGPEFRGGTIVPIPGRGKTSEVGQRECGFANTSSIQGINFAVTSEDGKIASYVTYDVTIDRGHANVGLTYIKVSLVPRNIGSIKEKKLLFDYTVTFKKGNHRG